VSDEGDNGLALHVCNDRPERFRGRLELALYRAGEVSVGRGELAVDVGAHAQLELPAAAAFEGFLDLSYAYRFGPAPYDVLAATLRRSDAPAGEVAASAFHFPVGLPAGRELDVGLAAEATVDGASARLTLRTRRFAQSVAIDCEGFAPEDAFFHLAPGEERMVRLSRTSNAAVLKGSVKALNSEATTRIVVATR
jgi:beta-mannosidase